MFSILLVLLIIVSVFMTGLILLQKSEGSGMSGSSASSMLGGMLTGASAGNFLTRLTAWLAAIFFVLCAALALVSSNMNVAQQQSDLRNEIVTQDSVTPSTTSGTEGVATTESTETGAKTTDSKTEESVEK
ncbi:MAG: preprotein translocase subunit SecG [Alphaproteobacteria bacterium]|nr:preprotein translocase subunit SecG [Alphaproteobacteria bacterium]